jgi:hypothetical protein
MKFSHDGISAIKEPSHERFFFTMEYRLSRSLSQNARLLGRLFSYISQRVFTKDPPR